MSRRLQPTYPPTNAAIKVDGTASAQAKIMAGIPEEAGRCFLLCVPISRTFKECDCKFSTLVDSLHWRFDVTCCSTWKRSLIDGGY
jgi:hypothetical protein